MGGLADSISSDNFLADFEDCKPAFLADHRAIRIMRNIHINCDLG